MRQKRVLITLSITLGAFLASTALALSADRESVAHAGKKAEISVVSDTRAGGLMLRKGSYQVQHLDMEDGSHVMVFRKMGGRGLAGDEVGRVECQRLPLRNRASETMAYLAAANSGERELRKIQIKGEAEEHLF